MNGLTPLPVPILLEPLDRIEFVEKERVGHGGNPYDHGTHLAQNNSKNQSLELGGYIRSFFQITFRKTEAERRWIQAATP